ncbi:serine carboxypeptidase-like 45 isoform X1 [Vicia villosa]|uniref:serine carboxypeptidase-like 45 isoform X1 n=1 Tax=Vicia villosa TaxID=3911 RepID=UPI00273C26FE|nr:serine carboxypeptidase-like 45 isoform X1 [Vicia villosa]
MNKKKNTKSFSCRACRDQKLVTLQSVFPILFQIQLISTIFILETLVKAGVRVLAFSGDQYSVIPFIGTEFLIEEMTKKIGLEITRPHESWFQGVQVAGWTQVYGNILTFATIKGAGHI